MWGRAVCSQSAYDRRAEGEDPAPDGFVAHLDAALSQELLDITVAEGEAQVHPDGAVDDLGREAITGVGGGGHVYRLRR